MLDVFVSYFLVISQYILLLSLFLMYNGYMNNNNNNNAGGGLRHPEGLYDDEDRTTNEGVLIRIKLKLL